jgi:hypothetical protein
MPNAGTAAARVAREDDVRSAAMPEIGQAAAQVTPQGGTELAAGPIV